MAQELKFRRVSNQYELISVTDTATDVMFRTPEVAILFDEDTFTVLRYGPPEDVVGAASSLKASYDSVDPSTKMSRSLKIVSSTRFSIADLNKILNTAGYMKVFLDKIEKSPLKSSCTFTPVDLPSVRNSSDSSGGTTLNLPEATYQLAVQIALVLFQGCGLTEEKVAMEIDGIVPLQPSEPVVGDLPGNLGRLKLTLHAAHRYLHVVHNSSPKHSPEALVRLMYIKSLHDALEELFWMCVRGLPYDAIKQGTVGIRVTPPDNRMVIVTLPDEQQGFGSLIRGLMGGG